MHSMIHRITQFLAFVNDTTIILPRLHIVMTDPSYWHCITHMKCLFAWPRGYFEYCYALQIIGTNQQITLWGAVCAKKKQLTCKLFYLTPKINFKYKLIFDRKCNILVLIRAALHPRLADWRRAQFFTRFLLLNRAQIRNVPYVKWAYKIWSVSHLISKIREVMWPCPNLFLPKQCPI